MCKIELKEEKKASCPNFPCFWPFPRRAAGLEYEMNKKTKLQRKNESDQKCYERSSSQNDPLLLPKVADISCFAAKRKPSSHLQTLLSSFRELLLLLGGSFYAILVNSCTFLWRGNFLITSRGVFFSYNRSWRLHVFCCINWTTGRGESTFNVPRCSRKIKRVQ